MATRSAVPRSAGSTVALTTSTRSTNRSPRERQRNDVVPARLFEDDPRRQRNTESGRHESQHRLIVGGLDAGEAGQEAEMTFDPGERRHQWRDGDEELLAKLAAPHAGAFSEAMLARDDQHERVVSQVDPRQARLVDRASTLERDAGRLARVAEHHGEIEIPGVHAWQQLVRLTLDDLELEAVIVAGGAQRVGDETSGGRRERAEADQFASALGGCGEVGTSRRFGLEKPFGVSQEKASRVEWGGLHAASARTAARRGRVRVRRCAATPVGPCTPTPLQRARTNRSERPPVRR